jgi:hypothetical protein
MKKRKERYELYRARQRIQNKWYGQMMNLLQVVQQLIHKPLRLIA